TRCFCQLWILSRGRWQRVRWASGERDMVSRRVACPHREAGRAWDGPPDLGRAHAAARREHGTRHFTTVHRCAFADQPLGASPRLAKPDAGACRLILVPLPTRVARPEGGGWHARIAKQGGHGMRRRTSGMLTLLRDVSMAPGTSQRFIDVRLQISRWALAHGWPNRTLARSG